MEFELVWGSRRTLRKEDCEPNQVSYNGIYGGWKAVGQIAMANCRMYDRSYIALSAFQSLARLAKATEASQTHVRFFPQYLQLLLQYYYL